MQTPVPVLIPPQIEETDLLSHIRDNESRNIQMVQHVAAAIYTCDANGFISFYNQAAVDLWGREPEIGIDLWCGSWKIYEPDGITPLSLDSCPMAIALKEGHSVRGREILVERPDGGRRHIMPYPDPVFNAEGKIIGAVNLLVDITDLKKTETALRESENRYKQIAEDLEKRVEERTEALRETNLALERSNSELEQVAFIASHDLQEPLRKIRTLSQRLEESAASALDQNSLLYLKKIKSSSDRMTILIKDILNYSRLEHLDAQFEKTGLDEVLGNVLNDLELNIEQKQTIIKADPLPALRAIPIQMHQLFFNLISNSIKFSREDIPCEIHISSRSLSKEETSELQLKGEKAYCEIILEDNGIGFSQDFAAEIFKIFNRLHTREKYEGNGIGLALCKKILNIHQGEIFAISDVNKGTAVHVILPV